MYWASPEWISCLSGAVTAREALKALSEVVEGMSIPRPPSLAGNASSLLSKSFRGGCPVRFGMNSDLRMSSSPFR